MTSIVITGATGFLGSHFLLRSQALPLTRIYCLIRGENIDHAKQRVTAALHTANEGYVYKYNIESILSQCVFVPADIEADLCAVSESTIKVLTQENIHSVWHFAASLNFEEEKSDFIEKRNVIGTHNIVTLANTIGCETFSYISTAYVAGVQQGDIQETYNDVDNAFNNYYEYSKNRAENLVKDLCTRFDLNYRILRPSIVIGPKSTAQPAGSTTGLYGIIQLLKQIAKITTRNNISVRIPVDINSKLNFVPVDQVIDDAFSLFNNNFAEGPIYHLTANNCLTFHECETVFSSLLDLSSIVYTLDEITDPTPLELIIQKKLAFYSAYMKSNKNFLRGLNSSNGIDLEDFNKYCYNALNVNKDISIQQHTLLLAPTEERHCQIKINQISSTVEANEVVIITNAYGMAANFWENVCNELSHSFDVIFWDAVDLADETVIKLPFEAIDDYGKALVDVIKSTEKPCHLVGWCTGAGVILKAYNDLPDNVRSISLLNGAFNLSQLEKISDYESHLKMITARAAKSKAMSDAIFDTIFKNSFTADLGDMQHNNKDSLSMLSAHSARYAHLTSQVYENKDVFFSYAKAINNYYQFDMAEVLQQIKHPVMLISGTDDLTIDALSSVTAHKLIDGSRLDVLDEMNHFGLHNDNRLQKHLFNFMTQPSLLSVTS